MVELEEVHLKKYPWVNGVVVADFGTRKMVKFENRMWRVIERSKLGVGHQLEGFEFKDKSDILWWINQIRRGITVAVKDEVVDTEVGDC